MGKEKSILMLGIIVSTLTLFKRGFEGSFSFVELIILALSLYVYFKVVHYTRVGVTFIVLGLFSLIVQYNIGFSFHGLIYILGGLMLISNEE